MRISTLSSYFKKLESTTRRLEMTALLADLFEESSKEEISAVVYLSLGRVGPLYEAWEFNIAEKMMIKVLSRAYDVDKREVLSEFKKTGDLGSVAFLLAERKAFSQISDLPVNVVFNRLRGIANASGAGSQEKKIMLLSALLKELDALSARYIVRVPLGTMRLGFSDITIIEALSWMKGKDKSLKAEIERRYRIHPDIGLVALLFKEGGLGGIKSLDIEVGVPVLSAKCQRVDTAEEIIEKLGKCAIEYKYDGTRVQLHLDRTKKANKAPMQENFFEGASTPLVRTFTRNLEESTSMFPDLIKGAIEQIDAESAILDCEAIGINPKTKEFVPFQVTIKRKRKYNVSETAEDIPLRLVAFDVLYCDGKSYIGKPFKERRALLEKIVKKGTVVCVAHQVVVDTPEGLLRNFRKAISKGLEGLVAKDLEAKYQVGARGYAWIKFKRQETGSLEDTLDCVVLGYYAGAGQRAKFGIGAFLVGVYNKKDDRFKTIAKIGTGLTDEQWGFLKEGCDKIKVSKMPNNYDVPKELTCDVWVVPKIVVAIRADQLTKSPIHTANYALRFPRLAAFRDDKSPQEATTVAEVKKLFRMQHL